jgi:hypothetical protein
VTSPFQINIFLGHLNTCPPSTQQEPSLPQDFPEMLKETSAALNKKMSEIEELKRKYDTEEDPIRIKFILEMTSKELGMLNQKEQSLLAIVAQEKFCGSSVPLSMTEGFETEIQAQNLLKETLAALKKKMSEIEELK